MKTKKPCGWHTAVNPSTLGLRQQGHQSVDILSYTEKPPQKTNTEQTTMRKGTFPLIPQTRMVRDYFEKWSINILELLGSK